MIKKMKTGNLLDEVEKKKQVDTLSRIDSFHNTKIKIYPYYTLNTCKSQ